MIFRAGHARLAATNNGASTPSPTSQTPSRLCRALAHTPMVTQAWVDAGFKQDMALHGALVGVDVEIVSRCDTRPGFVPIRRRWIVEQTNATLMLHRRLVREYDSRPESSVSRTWWASTANLVRRLTGTSTPTWRHR